MKTIDFTQPGGFPLTQDQLNYLQTAYTECINALAMMGGDGSVPVKLSGMSVTVPGTGAYDVTDGWFFYNGEMISFTASSVTAITSGFDAYVVISASAGTLIYNDGSTPGVLLGKTALLQILPSSTATDATHFPLSSLQPFGTVFGAASRETNWNTLVVSTASSVGGVTGTVYYKKDFTANTLQIRGLLSANNAQNFAASPGTLFYLMDTLPANYIPNHQAYFIAQYFVATSILDEASVAWIKQINCVVNSSGQLLINWLKPLPAVGGYGITFNTILPLD